MLEHQSPLPITNSTSGAPCHNTDSFQRQSTALLTGITITSRTVNGVSDTSCSTEKPKLDESINLQSISRDNLSRIFCRILSNGGIKFNSPEDVRQFIETVSQELNNGLGGKYSSIYRTWEVKGFAPLQDMQNLLSEFCGELYTKLLPNSRHNDDYIAAWVEHRFNGYIHPLADGCARTSALLAALILARSNKLYPQAKSREEFYSAIELPLSNWTEYYKCRISDMRPV